MRRTRASPEALAALALGAVPVVALGFADGGFFPRPWGWATVGLSMTAIAVLTARRAVGASRRAVVFVALLAALGIWSAASLTWTRSVSLSVPELQRLLVYLTGVGAATLLVRARSARNLVIGVFLGASAIIVSALVAYLLTREQALDVFQGAYLHRPLGYANAMAITAVLGIVLALGIIADAARRATRLLAGSALVPLAAVLALTGSRAAWGALFVGAAVAGSLAGEVGSTVRRWATVLVVPGLTVAAVSAADLPSSQLVGADADRAGERALVLVALLTVLGIGPAFVATRPSAARTTSCATRWLAVPALVVGLVVAAAVPSLSGQGERPAYWAVALAEARERPLLGSGAGTYAQTWVARRPLATTVRDAHSLPIEALSELGVVGLALVVLVLAAPFAWGVRARGRPLVPAATGAFAAYAVHAAVDWDWEMPAVTLGALFLAVALAASSDPEPRLRLRTAPARGVLVVVFAAAAAVAAAGFVASTAAENASRALARGDLAAAARDAATAERWQPWSVDPLFLRGRAALRLGDRDEAHRVFTRAAARDPNDYRVWLALATVSGVQEAEVALSRARGLNPRSLRAP